MKVKALKPHNNGYGEKFTKAKGDTYEVPDGSAKMLIDKGFVEEVKSDKKPDTAPPENAKTGKNSDGTK